MRSVSDMQRADFAGLYIADATGTAANGQRGPWTLSGSVTDPLMFRSFVVVLRSSGTITTATITLQGSMDNSTWFALQSSRLDTNAAAASLNYAGGGTIALGASHVDVPLLFARVDVAALTGGGTVFADAFLTGH